MPVKTTKRQKWFKREILDRFFSEQEMTEFLERYEEAKVTNVGRETLEKERA